MINNVSRDTTKKPQRSGIVLPDKVWEESAMIFFRREMGKHKETTKNENVLRFPTTPALVFFLTFLHVDVSTGGGG